MKGGKEKDNEVKPSEREIFGESGPVHLTCVDWRSPEHRRSVAASLVQGAYILERDRQQNRQGSKALAPVWWDYFHFQLVQILQDKDSSICGAIFQYKHPTPNCYPPTQNAPVYVIAFRGTITKPDSRARDFKLDIQFVLNGLTRNSRFQIAFQAIQSIVSTVHPSNIWLAGHSLGAAIALQAGKQMAKMGCYIETYLFNPPFASAPLEKIQTQALKDGIRFTNSIVTAGLTLAANGVRTGIGAISGKGLQSQNYDHFSGLYSWIPYLFVNPTDPICSEYVGYFEHREKMAAVGAGVIGRIAAQHSVVSVVSGALGRDGEAPHLIPCAFVTTNMSAAQDFKQAHGIHQWWKPHPYWQYKHYMLR
ncbi:hypothetical protein Ancab_009937 [Ancistrocladus abbreviatus]